MGGFFVHSNFCFSLTGDFSKITPDLATFSHIHQRKTLKEHEFLHTSIYQQLQSTVTEAISETDIFGLSFLFYFRSGHVFQRTIQGDNFWSTTFYRLDALPVVQSTVSKHWWWQLEGKFSYIAESLHALSINFIRLTCVYSGVSTEQFTIFDCCDMSVTASILCHIINNYSHLIASFTGQLG